MTNYALYNHRWYLVFFLIIVLSSSIMVTAAARLPAVGGDSGNWGTVLNQYLNVSLNGTGQLRANTISANNIVDSTIQDADIADTTNLTLGQKITFTFGEIVDNIVNDWVRITGNLNVTKNITAAYFVGDGSQLTAITLPDGGVTATKIATGAVNTTHITDNTIKNDDINSNAAISYSKIALANSIASADITSGAITASKLATGAVNTTHILDGTITAPDLATNSVNASHIVDETITSADIKNTANILDGQVTDALTVSGGTIGSNTISSGSTWATSGTLTIGDGGDAINISTANWKVSPTGVITGASMASTQLTDGGTLGFDWVDAEIDDTLTIGAGSSVVSTTLTDGGTLGFDWVDAEVEDTLTVAGGTIGSNTISSSSLWATAGALTIGDGGDSINISGSSIILDPTGSSPRVTIRDVLFLIPLASKPGLASSFGMGAIYFNQQMDVCISTGTAWVAIYNTSKTSPCND